MPREPIELSSELDRLSILDEDGGVDEELVPDLEDDTLLRMHRTMLLARRFDSRMLELHGAGELGTFAPVKGQEAAQIGAVAALQPVAEGDLGSATVGHRFLSPLCLGFDHRVNDGADAARFVRRLCDLLAEPESFALTA